MRAITLALAALLSGCATATPEPAQWSLAIHGGAGVIERASLSPEAEAQYRAAMNDALKIGGAILDQGGGALDAVQAVIERLEDDPLFNAGRGAVFTAEGRNELDASIMDGRTRAGGAVAGLTRTRHPIAAARAVMENSSHVMLIGEGAEAFARTQNLEEVSPSFFFTQRRWDQLETALRARGLPVPPKPQGVEARQGAILLDDHRFGTVGAVARDRNGDLAAGTSTGGVTAKRWSRVGDAPILGAGTYAQNGVCAVSATGTGEYFIRLSVARTICARMEFDDQSAEEAADIVVGGELTALQGDGGVIVMDANGHAVFAMNTPGMYRGRASAQSAPEIYIFADEEH